MSDEPCRISTLEASLEHIRNYLVEPQYSGPGVMPPSLGKLCESLALSGFERDLLLLCLAVELDPQLAELCARAANDQNRPFPTFILALSILPNADFHAIRPDAPLRRYKLLMVEAGPRSMHNPLFLPERVVHFLVGHDALDQELTGMILPAPILEETHERQQVLAAKLANLMVTASDSDRHLQIFGATAHERRRLASLACQNFERRLFLVGAAELPDEAGPLRHLLDIWQREVLFSDHVLYVETEDQLDFDTSKGRAVYEILSAFEGGLLILGMKKQEDDGIGSYIPFEIPKTSYGEQRQLWLEGLVEKADGLKDTIDILVSQFALSESDIMTACAIHKELDEDIGPRLREYCRTLLQPALDAHATRIQVTATFDDIVLPKQQQQMLEAILRQVHYRVKVYEDWRFGGKSIRDVGISALFHGPSGTGKTMAAEVLADTLGLNLYRVDLSSVISKYIGETEKNLSRIFDAADKGGAILLFDEADAIFGKRSDVRNSHDRYANIEVAYLLQRMESFNGLAILTTNLKDGLDEAFLRRIRFFVNFPFPSERQRSEIWKRVFPKEVPLGEMDYERLSKIKLSGANIRNIAINAAFLAAEQGGRIEMPDILEAAKQEFEKTGRYLVVPSK